MRVTQPAASHILFMEYIDGTPIDVHAQSLDLREKLCLFLLVCDAISYAHRNLVVHHDLKPSNVLVDSSGQPKLLHFWNPWMLDETERIQTRERLLSADYASPEQVRGAHHSKLNRVFITSRAPIPRPRNASMIVARKFCAASVFEPITWNRTIMARPG